MDPEDDSQVDKVLELSAANALVAARAVEKLNERLIENDAMKLYQNIELPLVFTLSDMEKVGMIMDREALICYGEELSVTIHQLEKSIYEEAGEEFNINSPKQLSTILFEKMAIPGGKKTKTGYSTAADVLEKLAPWNPIIEHILDYRKYAKLKSTYVDGLADCLGQDGRVHSTFQQKVTATGRISSTNPNLQNIPVRMEIGKKIRKVFHPKEGYVFLDADYSQIELRVLAHLSGDENMIKAYLNGQDIHKSTASLVFHTPFDEVTPLQRRNAKAVNFGIVYGISAFGLSEDLKISQKEAKEYIENYYAAYPKLKEYIDGLVSKSKETGYAETLFGRRRPIPELKSSNFMQRQFGERVAMNSPVQGTAADIIKIAMVRVHDRLAEEKLSSRLVLQVHDELLIEAKQEELEQVKAILKEEMMGAASMAVPLEIDMEVGDNWYDVH
ncbi:MAG TPA: DNA polymerase I [Lachnospiraceae bacterium]|nr:DNA polymerase I [Lachnospiraceae bacterium]